MCAGHDWLLMARLHVLTGTRISFHKEGKSSEEQLGWCSFVESISKFQASNVLQIDPTTSLSQSNKTHVVSRRKSNPIFWNHLQKPFLFFSYMSRYHEKDHSFLCIFAIFLVS